MLKNMYKNEMKLEFVGRASNVAFARISVASFVAQLDPTIEEMSDIKTAVSEAVTNSIVHGYEEKDGIVVIFCGLTENEIHIEIEDYGKGIEDIEKAREPLYTSKPEEERAGMGFTIMENFMEDLKVISNLNQGTKISFKKTIQR